MIIIKIRLFSSDLYHNDGLEEWIGVFLHACHSRNLAVGTIEFYRRSSLALFSSAQALPFLNISQITADHIRCFLIYLEERETQAWRPSIAITGPSKHFCGGTNTRLSRSAGATR